MSTALSRRVASRFLAGEEPDDMGAPGPEEHTSFVPSGPSLKMFTEQVDAISEAIEKEDDKSFDKAMDSLNGYWDKYKNKGWEEKDRENQDEAAKEMSDWMNQ